MLRSRRLVALSTATLLVAALAGPAMVTAQDGITVRSLWGGSEQEAFQKVLDHVRKANPWLVIVGRIGVHSAADETGLGSDATSVAETA